MINVEFKREYIETKQYLIDYIFSNINSLIMYSGLLIGMQILNKNEDVLFLFINGIIIWRISVISITSFSLMLQNEIRIGTFEQLFLVKTKMIYILVYRIIVTIFIDIAIVFSILIITTFLMGARFSLIMFLEPQVLFVYLMALIGMTGLGLIAGGATLVYKKASAVARTASNFILFFSGLIVPLDIIPSIFRNIANFFPYKWMMLILNKNALLEEYIILFVISVLWLTIGYSIYIKSIKHMLTMGTTSQY